MVQVPILSGIYAKTTADFARSFPVNLTPIAEPGDTSGTGISKGYLKLSPGIVTVDTTGKPDRGGYLWRDQHVRVIGSDLVRVASDGARKRLGDVGNGGPVTFAQSFDRLAINSGDRLYYWDGSSLVQVTDEDLGPVVSLTWQDGYFVTTDGTSIVVTELTDPAKVDPLKYGSSEADPDPVTGLLSLRSELYALNRYTIEKFVNGGSAGFPFRRSTGSQIPKGCVGPHAFSQFVETFAFVGSGRNEAPCVYLAGSGQGIRISPRLLDEQLGALSPANLAAVEVETRNGAGMIELLVHLPSCTWAYHWIASQQLDIPVWSVLASGAMADQPYPARHFTLADGRWWCGSIDELGYADESVTTLFGETAGFRFDTPMLFNAGTGALVHDLELVGLTGRGELSAIAMSYTDDGVTWSQERFASTGYVGERNKRPAWRRVGRMRNWRGFRFRGIAKSPVAFARLEARVEPLNG